jgi:hypothetical protein
MGEITSGKTHAVRTLVDAGIEVFYLATEPGFEEMLGDIPSDKLHWNYVAPYQDDFTVVRKKAELIRDFTDAQLKAMGGINKEKHTQIFDIMNLCNDFHDLRTGQKFGDVGSWGPDRAFVIDGLTGLSKMAEKLKIGDKPFMEQNDYYAAQQILRDLIGTCVSNTNCLFVLTAHIEYEPDLVAGVRKLMVRTIGQKLAPDIPTMFSDAILTERSAKLDPKTGKPTFHWVTIREGVTTKARNLPWSEDLKADFGPLVANWRNKWINEQDKPGAAT